MSIPANRRRARYRAQALRSGCFELLLALLSSRLLPPSFGRSVVALGYQASLDQFRCHVVSDESAEKLDQPYEHRFQSLGRLGVSTRHNAVRDPFDVRLGPGAELNLLEGGVLRPRFRERPLEKSVAAVRTNPARELAIQIVARGASCSRGGVGALRMRRATADQPAHDLLRRRTVSRERVVTPFG